jgi:23S rRNA (guanosine2251-2'-O)-methyltransferase
MRNEKIYMYGKHALLEALRSTPEMLDKVYLVDRADGELAALLHTAGISVDRFDPRTLPTGVERDANHQGYIGRVSLHKLVHEYGDFVSTLKVDNDACLIVLGEIQDPQNVGAIIRTAAAFGVAGVLIPEHNQAQVTGTVVKVSAGMAFRVPLVSIGNVNTTLKDLKERGFWTYGLDGEATQSVGDEPFDAPTVFVFGNEHNGIRQKTLESCDVPLVIPMHPGCESLNVGASAAVALYAWSVKHPGALR